MFYRIIQRKRDEWLSRKDCPVRFLLSYIESRGMLRDAQVDAIKTYLFLKIECGGRPLWRLFAEGAFRTLNLSNMSLTVTGIKEIHRGTSRYDKIQRSS